MILAYFTPEVALPVVSIIGAAMGFFMLVGRGSIKFVVKGFRRIVEKLNI